MRYAYIAIEKNTEGFDFYKDLWSKRGITGYMADSMTNAIETAISIENSNAEQLYFVSIVEEQINYLPQLNLLREATSAPILIASTLNDNTTHQESLKSGADWYAPVCDTAEGNIQGVMVAVERINQTKNRKATTDLIICNGILLSPLYRKAFVNDTEVELTKREFDILLLLIKKPEQVFTHSQIINKVWSGEYENADKALLWNSIKRLREKLRATPNGKQYIETVREVGYRFSLK